MSLRQARATFADPPREFGLIPLWFWNDDLQEEVLLEQLHAFYEAGFGGVAPHPRLGLSRRVGYLTDEYFRLLRLVVTEAARLGMKIILYDEGSYPSGSANGAVVAENPQYASQCISLWEREITGPFCGYWRPNTGRALLDRHVCTVLGRVRDDGEIEADSVRVLDTLPHDIVHIEVPAGRWKAMSVWQTHSGGIIRGVLAEEESGHATAPASSGHPQPGGGGALSEPHPRPILQAPAGVLRHDDHRAIHRRAEYFGQRPAPHGVPAALHDRPRGLAGGAVARDSGAMIRARGSRRCGATMVPRPLRSAAITLPPCSNVWRKCSTQRNPSGARRMALR